MKTFYCPYFDDNVELTDERILHIRQKHPDVEPFIPKIQDVLSSPELIRQKYEVLLFSLHLKEIRKNLVVIIKQKKERNFILTYYLTSKIKGGEILWTKKD